MSRIINAGRGVDGSDFSENNLIPLLLLSRKLTCVEPFSLSREQYMAGLNQSNKTQADMLNYVAGSTRFY